MVILRVVGVIVAVLVIVGVLWDGFETVVLPRRVSRRFRLTRAYFRGTWRAWSTLSRHAPALARRESFLAVYGPLALLALLALWAALLIAGYAMLLWGLGSPLSVSATGARAAGFGTDLYFSGTTFLTLGLGDVFPRDGPARAIAVVEVGTGFALLALVVGYLPVLYQAFSRRETRISQLDAHAGSPPTAGALLLRHPPARRARRLTALLAEWEGWSAELLETHLSYPVLAYYRSQHEEQSWVAALTVILDACALVLSCGASLVGDTQLDEELAEQAAFTFAMARHAAVDLAQVFGAPTARAARQEAAASAQDGRLPRAERTRLHNVLAALGVAAGAGTSGTAGGGQGDGVQSRLDELRALYERYIEGLAQYLLMTLPPWAPAPDALDDWQTTADGLTAPSVEALVQHRSKARNVAPSHTDRTSARSR